MAITKIAIKAPPPKRPPSMTPTNGVPQATPIYPESQVQVSGAEQNPCSQVRLKPKKII